MKQTLCPTPDVPAGADFTVELHRHLHWCTLRAICRNRTLRREQRRAKLRFVLDGLARHED